MKTTSSLQEKKKNKHLAVFYLCLGCLCLYTLPQPQVEYICFLQLSYDTWQPEKDVFGSWAPCNDLQTCSLVPATLAKNFMNYDQEDTTYFFSGVA